ncbi:ER membrane protein complex subunit 5-like [Planococcus citri]|uniref:ER membrane protein complex subunit 5-like n=1 Tax=Planococcus citri TaxID=170843 RepID=UPI0031F7632C
MSRRFYRNLTILSLLSLCHTAYSAAKHRSYLRLKEQENGTLPLDIIVQGILSLVIAMIGIVNIAGEFKEISATKNLERKSWETLRNVPSFYVFNHRGQALSPDYNSTEAIQGLS